MNYFSTHIDTKRLVITIWITKDSIVKQKLHKKKDISLLITVTYYTSTNQEHIILVQHINGTMINPKKSHKDLKGILKINFTMLQQYTKIIPIKYAVKYITLQHGNK